MKQNNNIESSSLLGLLEMKIAILQEVILSNQAIIDQQKITIDELNSKLTLYQQQGFNANPNQQRNSTNASNVTQKDKEKHQMSLVVSGEQDVGSKECQCGVYRSKISQLESELVETKMHLAELFSTSLEKDQAIQGLNKSNQQLTRSHDQLLKVHLDLTEQLSNRSQTDSTISNYHSRSFESQENLAEFDVEAIKVNRDNIEEFIFDAKSVVSKWEQNSLSIVSKYHDHKVSKLWNKLLISHRSQKYYANNSKESFVNATYDLMIKSKGVPFHLRTAVWPFLIVDRLAITKNLYHKLLQKVEQNMVDQKVRQQIQKDMIRSFNGQSSKENLKIVYEKSRGIFIKPHQTKDQLETITMLRTKSEKISDENDNDDGIIPAFVRKNTQQASEKSSLQNPATDNQQLQVTQFPVPQIPIRVLQIFSLYRPDIGFVQGMTYPTIIFSLVLDQIQTFTLLSNVLLSGEFFVKMITVEEGFVDEICRVFDRMLMKVNVKLYNRVVKELHVRSEVFIVDWFWTFYSRNLSPQTILRIWDLFLYHLSKPHPQLILYQLSLTIMQLLEPILFQTNYEETIRTIREYWRKIDENEMIEKTYEKLSNWERIVSDYRKLKNEMGKR